MSEAGKSQRPKPVVLVIIDGFGIAPADPGNAITQNTYGISLGELSDLNPTPDITGNYIFNNSVFNIEVSFFYCILNTFQNSIIYINYNHFIRN